jgi:hypothetical protein
MQFKCLRTYILVNYVYFPTDKLFLLSSRLISQLARQAKSAMHRYPAIVKDDDVMH